MKAKNEHSLLSLAKSLSVQLETYIYYLILVLLPTQLGRHFWPSFSFVYGVRIDYLSPVVYVTDVLILLLFLIVMTQQAQKLRIMNNELRKEEKPRFSFLSSLFTKRNILIALFLVTTLVGIVLSKSPQNGLVGLIKFLELSFFGWYTAVEKKSSWKKVIFCFASGVIVESLLGFFQVLHGGSLNGIWYFLGERTFSSETPGIANASVNGELLLRPYATFSHPNVLAAYLLFACFLLIASIRCFKKVWQRIFLLCIAILGVAAVITTLSRVSILLLFLVPLLFLSQNKKKIQRVLFVLFCLFFIIALVPVRQRFLGFSFSDESFTQRLQLDTAAVAMFRDHLFFGVGIRNFLVLLPSYVSLRQQFFLQPVHNIFLLWLSETGIVGCFFLFFFAQALFKGILKKTSAEKVLLFILLLSITIEGLFDHYFLTLQQGQLLLAFFCGICFRQSIFPATVSFPVPKAKKLSKRLQIRYNRKKPNTKKEKI